MTNNAAPDENIDKTLEEEQACEEVNEEPEEAKEEKEEEKTCEGEEVKEEESEKSEKDEEDEDLKAKHLRLMADFQNYRRRAEEAKLRSYSHGREDLVTEILPVLDNFERALEADSEDGNFKEGIEMIFKQLMDQLTKAGLSEIEALGEEFDPNFHNAVMTEDSEEYDSNHVTAVLQKGYKFKDKVIRPSMVKVSN